MVLTWRSGLEKSNLTIMMLVVDEAMLRRGLVCGMWKRLVSSALPKGCIVVLIVEVRREKRTKGWRERELIKRCGACIYTWWARVPPAWSTQSENHSISILLLPNIYRKILAFRVLASKTKEHKKCYIRSRYVLSRVAAFPESLHRAESSKIKLPSW